MDSRPQTDVLPSKRLSKPPMDSPSTTPPRRTSPGMSQHDLDILDEEWMSSSTDIIKLVRESGRRNRNPQASRLNVHLGVSSSDHHQDGAAPEPHVGCDDNWCWSWANWLRLRWVGVPLSLGVLVLVALIGVVALVLYLPFSLTMLAVGGLMGRYFDLIVEHAYRLPPGRHHVTLARWTLKHWDKLYWHSRFLDCRTDMLLPRRDHQGGPGRCSIHVIPCLADNLGYLVVDLDSYSPDTPVYKCFVVDPCDATAVHAAIQEIARVHYHDRELHVEAILVTHKHWDHQAGNKQLIKYRPTIKHVYGSHIDQVLACTDFVENGAKIFVGGIQVDVVATPCHTRGSLTFLIKGHQAKDVLFTGDTLFCGGCGATFEGDNVEMVKNCATIIAACSPNTLLFPGHEYSDAILSAQISTLKWGTFSPSLFFHIAAVYYRASHRRSLQVQDNLLTVPWPLSEELYLNPNMRQVVEHCSVLSELVRKVMLHTPSVTLLAPACDNKGNDGDHDADVNERNRGGDVDEENHDPSSSAHAHHDQTKHPSQHDDGGPTTDAPSDTDKPCDTNTNVVQRGKETTSRDATYTAVGPPPPRLHVITHESYDVPAFAFLYGRDMAALEAMLEGEGNKGFVDARRLLRESRQRLATTLDTSGEDFLSKEELDAVQEARSAKEAAAGNQDAGAGDVESGSAAGNWLSDFDFDKIHDALVVLGVPARESKWAQTKSERNQESVIHRRRLRKILLSWGSRYVTENPDWKTDIAPLWPEECSKVPMSKCIYWLCGRPSFEMLHDTLNKMEKNPVNPDDGGESCCRSFGGCCGGPTRPMFEEPIHDVGECVFCSQQFNRGVVFHG